MEFRQPLRFFRGSWNLLICALVCLATALGNVLLPVPAGVLESNEKASFGLAGLAGAALVGLMAIPVRLWHQRKHLRLWGAFTILSLALVLVVFLSYAYFKDSWSLQYAGKTVITGSTYVPSVPDYKRENPQYSDLQLLQDAAGNSSLVWTPDSIRTHRHILAGLYIASLPAFAIFLVSLAQAVYCADRKGTRRRVPEVIEPPKKPSVGSKPAQAFEPAPSHEHQSTLVPLEKNQKAYRYDAFISYRHSDRDKRFARKLLRELEQSGYIVAIDERDFDASASFLDEMERCIRDSRFTLAIVSTRYLESGNCQEEAVVCKVLDMDERRQRLVPLIIEKAQIPAWLFGIVGIDFTRNNPLISPNEKVKATLGQPSNRARSSPEAS
jgi:TIR domain